jgi:hypothetical protein
MADNQTKDNQDLIKYREAVSNSYAALRSEQSVNSFYAYTFDEALKGQLDRIKVGTTNRPSLLNKVDSVLNTITAFHSAIKELPQEAFKMESNTNKDVNTATADDELRAWNESELEEQKANESSNSTSGTI